MGLNRIFECQNPACTFRFPAGAAEDVPAACPRCGIGELILITTYPSSKVESLLVNRSAPTVEAVLDNIRSSYNVGSIFRSADGAGVARLHLCGITPTPNNPRVAKTALGAEEAVPWVYHESSLEAAKDLAARSFRLWALEGGINAFPITSALSEAAGNAAPIALVCGNEITGVDPDLLAMCERHIVIPMQGVKDSLNVAVAFGVAVYFLRNSDLLAP